MFVKESKKAMTTLQRKDVKKLRELKICLKMHIEPIPLSHSIKLFLLFLTLQINL